MQWPSDTFFLPPFAKPKVRASVDHVCKHQPIQQLEDRRYLAAPVLDEIADQVMPAGKTIHVPLTAADGDGNALHYVVTSDNAEISANLTPVTNTWLRLSTTQGTMQFQLFDDLAPRTVANMVGLVNAGYFNGQDFYSIARAADNSPLLVQSGSPTGTATGGPGYRFDDEFHPDAVFSNAGVLAMLNAGKDTNGSQFFVTAKPARTLDFNYTIWGQLVRGFGTLSKLFGVPVVNNVPVVSQQIKSASVITDTTDAVLMVKASDVGSANITVKVDDGGEISTRVFQVEAQADQTNQTPNDDPPILKPPADMVIPKNKSATIELGAYDLEGDTGEYAVTLVDSLQGSASVSADVLTFTPRKNLTGPVKLFVGVRAPGATKRGNFQNAYDTQQIQIGVGDLPASGKAITIEAVAGIATGNVSLATFVDSDVTATAADWSATATRDALGDASGGINWGDATISDGTIARTKDGKFSVFGAHIYGSPGRYPVTLTVEGNLGARLMLQGLAIVREFGEIQGNTLMVNGTGADDVIGISPKRGYFNVNINGVVKKYPSSGIGRVEVRGYGGDDQIDIGGGVPGTYIDGGTGNDLINGGDGNDTVTGGAGKNTVNGNAGNDRVNGSGGRDYLIGGEGNDFIYANGGDDTLDGGGGVDRMFGGAGNDLLIGGGSNDKLSGDAGNDTLIGGKASDSESGGEGYDIAQQDGTDVLTAVESIL